MAFRRSIALCALALAAPSAPHAAAQPARPALATARGAPIRDATVVLFAEDNTNQRYQLWVRYARRAACEEARVVLGDRTIDSGGYGEDAQTCSASFHLDRAAADRAAARFHIARQDRRPIGEAVTGTFAVSAARVRPGEPIEVVLTMQNPAGAPVVGWLRGGRNRGVRDNQFQLVILRDGRPIAPVEGLDMGGLSYFPRLAPGERAEVRAPIGAWGDLSVPGRYEVRCAYETTFVPDGVDPNTDDHRGEQWDRRFEGVVRFEVR